MDREELRMMKGIARKGDETTHGGKVLEGIPDFLIDGIPAAGVGHMVWCPRCKGVFPIVEGDSSFTAYGFSIALHGMRTACGATLISSVGGFADVEHPRGGAGFASAYGSPNYASASVAADSFDDHYILLDSDSGTPLQNTEYAIVRDGGAAEFGITDGQGRTHLLTSQAQAEDVTIYVEG